jgi:hypothetical protein
MLNWLKSKYDVLMGILALGSGIGALIRADYGTAAWAFNASVAWPWLHMEVNQ